MRRLLVAAVLSALAAAATAAEQGLTNCPGVPAKTRVTLSLRARRNATGHWRLQVQTVGDTGRGRELQMDVDAEVQTLQGSSGMVQLTSSAEWAWSRGRPPQAAPEGYERAPGGGGSLYKVFAQAASWDAAALRCLADGAHLVVVDSEREAAVVRGLFATDPRVTGTAVTDHWHAGFHNRYDLANTISVLGDPLPAWALVQIEAPEKYPDQRCGRVKSLGQYVRGPCDAARAFICEYEDY